MTMNLEGEVKNVVAKERVPIVGRDRHAESTSRTF